MRSEAREPDPAEAFAETRIEGNHLSAGWCPIVAGLDVVSTRAAFLVLREAFYGATKFDEFVTRAGISPPIASARLRELVERGVLHQEPYREEGQRTRQRYLLTEKGADLFPVLISLAQWSLHWLGDESAVATHRGCGATVRVRVRCDKGHDVSPDQVDMPVREVDLDRARATSAGRGDEADS
jgi:DNA-binding HxlR family transcriptional regulator